MTFKAGFRVSNHFTVQVFQMSYLKGLVKVIHLNNKTPSHLSKYETQSPQKSSCNFTIEWFSLTLTLRESARFFWGGGLKDVGSGRDHSCLRRGFQNQYHHYYAQVLKDKFYTDDNYFSSFSDWTSIWMEVVLLASWKPKKTKIKVGHF